MNNLKQNNIKLIDEIINLVQDYYDVNIFEDTNSPTVSSPRMNAVYLIRKFTTNVTLDYIAKKFNRKHSNMSTMLKRLTESLPFDKKRENDLKRLELIIQTSSEYYSRNEKDDLIVKTLNKLNTMSKQQVKHFLKQTEDYLENFEVIFEEVK